MRSIEDIEVGNWLIAFSDHEHEPEESQGFTFYGFASPAAKKRPGFTRVPYEVKAIDLPFAVLANPTKPQPIVVNLRHFHWKRVDDAFAKAATDRPKGGTQSGYLSGGLIHFSPTQKNDEDSDK